jgi:transcriptional regulator with XRE-family HTH domain
MGHPLSDYIEAAGDTVADFAVRSGLDEARLSRILSFEERPDPALARRLSKASGGVVVVEDFFADASVLNFPDRDNAPLDLKSARDAVEHVLESVGAGPELLTRSELDEAAEVVVATDAALCGVTSRGPDRRLVLALTSVLAEILKDSSATPPRERLETAALEALRICLRKPA